MNMKELAKICGVSVATVSYALRNDERISQAVRERIQAKARELNYRPNSLSSALVRYRTGSKGPEETPAVAVVYAHPKTSRRTELIQTHIDNLRHAIRPYGYRLKEFYLGETTDAATQLAEQLHAEGIRGIIVAWGQWNGRMVGFPWQEFVVVSAERNEVHPALDRVSMNHFSATDLAFHQLEKLGVRRIGLICHDDLPIRVRKNIVGAYLMNVRAKENWATDIPPYFYSIGEDGESFREWFDRYQPDAILSHRQIDMAFYASAGIEFPRDAQYAVIEIDDSGPGVESGVLVNEDLGSVLAETIAGKLHYDDHVQLENEGSLILVDGEWRAGRTTAKPPSSPATPA
ncbi:LacI family DNA-binding transcriptional regulator [Coraliomargarita parva]|uniref:LacI family DNA-binding transcriptional regulator n=1 Tax=Coraliomargarita parva TaxID=3014050 RepID=UPI0022B56ACA|nr:LacI family DNA-binding transcriptional regulator [Coraliomargarita parva]